MRNRLTSNLDANDPTRRGSAWDVDADPALRLTWLFVAMALPLLVVAGRLVHLQWVHAEDFSVEERSEVVSLEQIPARNGRILAADGTVLAYDEERFRVLSHYRWLEEPPNDKWLRDAASQRLNRADRRNQTKLAEAQQQVLEQRDSLWKSLAELTDSNSEQLSELRSRTQQRVERIMSSIAERNTEEASDTVSSSESPTASKSGLVPLGRKAWDVVVHELTTSPTRERKESLRIPEQSDYHILLDDVSLEVVGEIESHPERFPGLRTEVTTRRVYPQGRLAPHLIGHRGEINADELTARKNRFPHGDPLDYQSGDSVGRDGVEQTYEHILRGVRGQRRLLRDRHGAIARTDIVRSPRPGRDVVLSFHVALQENAQSLLNEVVDGASATTNDQDLTASTDTPQDKPRRPLGGCIVAIDVRTGAILAAASAPTFDINDVLAHGVDDTDPRRPMFPRVTQMTIAPGSVFKTISAVALLESGQIDPDRTIECQGYLDKPTQYRCYTFSHYGVGHFDTDLTKALAQSCNVYFFKAARTIGPQPLVDWADRFGIGQKTGIDVPGELPGHLPRPPAPSPQDLANRRAGQKSATQKTKSKTNGGIELAHYEQTDNATHDILPASPWDESSSARNVGAKPNSKPTPWYPGDTLGLAIGQSQLTVTPLQIVRMMAAVANDGWLVTPHVVSELSALPIDADKNAIGTDDVGSTTNAPLSVMPNETIAPPRQKIQSLNPETLARIREGLEQVVAHPKGTGFKTVRLKDVDIAGKTGTAEIGTDRMGHKRPDHAWFAGYVPADKPQIAFVVVLEQAGSGGKAAGPVAKKLVQALLDQHVIHGK